MTHSQPPFYYASAVSGKERFQTLLESFLYGNGLTLRERLAKRMTPHEQNKSLLNRTCKELLDDQC